MSLLQLLIVEFTKLEENAENSCLLETPYPLTTSSLSIILNMGS